MKTEKEIVAKLMLLLEPSRIKKHPYTKFDYIESWDAIKTANEIFGFFGWSSNLDELRLVSEEKLENGKYEVSYMATSTITVRYIDSNGQVREVTHSGSGHDIGTRKKLSEAHGMAIKNAESDAEKRALRKLGNQFGLALYDESGAGVGTNAQSNSDNVNFKDIERIAVFLGREMSRAEKESFNVADFKEKLTTESVKLGVQKLREESPEDYSNFEQSYKKAIEIISKRESSEGSANYL